MALVLRSARAADAGNICALHVESWRDVYDTLFTAEFLEQPVEDALAAHWHELLRGRRRAGQVVLAVTGRQVNGFVALLLEGNTGHIDNLHVRPGMRGAGIGRKLLGLAAQRLRQQGGQAADVRVFAANTGAIRFYRRLGGQLGPPMPRQVFGQDVTERVISWPDIARLANVCET